MLWYSLDDITAAYRITKEALKQRIKSGKLKSQKLPMNRGKAHKPFKYIISETELPSLEALKLQGLKPVLMPSPITMITTGARRTRKNGTGKNTGR